MEVLNNLLGLLNSIPSDAWSVIVETVFSAITVSSVALAIKKFFAVDGDRKMLLLVMFGSFIAGGLDYLHGIPLFAPYFALIQGWIVLGMTQPVYRFFVKPLGNKLAAWLSKKIAQATSVNEAKNAASALPVSTTANDFSH
jgi:hypothetical protein